MNKQASQNSTKSGRELLVNQCSERKIPLLQFAIGEISRDELTLQDWIQPLKRSDGRLCIMFPSGNGGYYVRYRPDCGLKIVYAGPYGAEIRPANLDGQNLHHLIERADWIEVNGYGETPYTDLEVTGNA